MGMSAANPANYDDIYSFKLTTSTPETVTIAGGEFSIADFNIAGPAGFTYSLASGFFNGSVTLGSGDYSFMITGTGTPGSPFGFSAYNGNIFTPAAV